MRVLVVDQDSASNEAIVRSLREHYTVDAVTNKGDCLDLLRSNTFEVIVATERLEDGSGLELLGQVGKKWPSVLRIFAADRQRLQLLRGRLGPFDLFQTLAYPIDPERLIATLDLATAAQDAHADTTNIQHVVLSGEPPPDPEEEIEDVDEEESEDSTAPRRVARISPREHVAVGTARRPARAEPVSRTEPPSESGQPRRNGAAGSPRPSAAASGAARTSAAGALPRTATRVGAPAGTGAASGSEGQTPPGRGGRHLRHGRYRGSANKPPPARFPPLEPPRDFAAARSAATTDSLSEAAAMARAARSSFESPSNEIDTRRLAMMVGGGAAALLVVVILGFRLFGSKAEAPPAATPPVAKAPEYPQEVTDLIAQTETAFKTDDFKSARADVDKLRQLAPSHPRLSFFEGLLIQRADAATPATSALNSAKRNRKTSKRSGSTTQPGITPASTSNAVATSATEPSGTNKAGLAAAADGAVAVDRAATADRAAVDRAPAADGAPPLLAETPPGLTRNSAAPNETPKVSPADTAPTQAAPAQPKPEPAIQQAAQPQSATPAASAPPSASAPAASSAAPATPRRPISSEPPPVVREAKLIRRVDPDYPSAAKRDGVAGSVDLEVTISPRGVVQDVSVVHSTPPDLFDKSAVAAVRKWKYDPRFVDGLPAEAHVKVHLEFGPNR